ncbi:hypothetical protein CGLO_10205 [Colletotrichum gloeosporioides Cg-14]|uniref:Uncharacterized protein n=1 Tax=Colletotrichum gloeosporioides (strain Cg-14) TaxID=1237896 RepID=T0LQA0_COLGC|nr:hypothetical protein CGLO_10205 [Colletotrichum gloeosporioides Cg-14]
MPTNTELLSTGQDHASLYECD